MDLGTLEAPPARRASMPGWRDPRLWVGLAIVAASVLAGGVVLRSADDTIAVWAASGPLGAGQPLTPGEVAVRRVRFADAADAALYLRADRQLPSGLHLSRDVGSGELVPRAAVTSATGPVLRSVPVSVPLGHVPGSVAVGDHVDLYLLPQAQTACRGPVCAGRPALTDVTVLDAPPPDDEFGADGSRMLVLAMTGGQARRFFALLATTDGASPTVVEREPVG